MNRRKDPTPVVNQSSSTIFDVEDVVHEIEQAVFGEVIEYDGTIVFRLDSKIVEIDITNCAEIPINFTFKKYIESGCVPDKCIAENRKTCAECKFQLFANEVEFKAHLLYAKRNTDKKLMATYRVK
jgi:hypothetical protein